MRPHGPWQIRSTREVHRDGTLGTFSVVRVLPFDEGGAVYPTEEFRYAAGRPSLEAVGGGVEPDGDIR
jgi:hypothetical protein